jgi:hypothetical protein
LVVTQGAVVDGEFIVSFQVGEGAKDEGGASIDEFAGGIGMVRGDINPRHHHLFVYKHRNSQQDTK